MESEKPETTISYIDEYGFEVVLTFTNNEQEHEESVKAVKEFFMREVL